MDGEKFSDISDVVPHIEPSHKTCLVVPRNAYEPRCFKIHALTAFFDGKQLYVYCSRNARRVAASFVDWLVHDARSESDEVRAEAFRIWNKIISETTPGSNTFRLGKMLPRRTGRCSSTWKGVSVRAVSKLIGVPGRI